MADRDAIRDRAIRRHTEKLKRSVTWGDVVSAFQAATPAERQTFAASIYGNDPAGCWRLLDRIVLPQIRANATTVVDAAMADDSFTLDEFETLFL